MRMLGKTVAGAALMVGALAPPARAQAACQAGLLSTYLASAAVGCRVGGLHVDRFTWNGLGMIPSDQVWLQPFMSQGPTGYSWLGFRVQFLGGAASQVDALGPQASQLAKLGFWTNDWGIYGLQSTVGTSPNGPWGPDRTRVTLAMGSTGARVTDVLEPLPVPFHQQRACGFNGVSTPCANGTEYVNGMLTGTPGDYAVLGESLVSAGGTSARDYAMGVLVDSSTVVPEPATMGLVATGLFGLGGMARRKRSSKA